jgi:hypothetical protein
MARKEKKWPSCISCVIQCTIVTIADTAEAVTWSGAGNRVEDRERVRPSSQLAEVVKRPWAGIDGLVYVRSGWARVIRSIQARPQVLLSKM